MRRREFVALFGAAATWPISARAQSGRRRRIGVLMNVNAGDPDQQANIESFVQVLRQLGWNDGDNVQIEVRWAGGSFAAIAHHAGQLIALEPDILVATGNAGMGPLLQATRTIPIVFNSVVDPVGSGFVNSLAQPGGNATGFMQFDYSLTAKWLELLKEIAPRVTRAAVLRDPSIVAGIAQFAVIQSVSASVGIDVRPINLTNTAEIERSIASFASVPNAGLILTASALAIVHRELIIELAARHQLPVVYYRRYFVDSGGLVAYGYDVVQQFRGTAEYVSRVLNGEKPADLPVQAPNRYELVINLKTAKALGLTIPPTVLARADEVIE